VLHFIVYGVAQPKGSTRSFLPKGWQRPVVTSDNPKNAGWQHLVADGASRAIALRPAVDRRLLEGGVRLSIAFYLPTPQKFQTGPYVRGRALPPHTTKPDLDKLVRAVKDALTKIAWRDDAQVIDVVAIKRYTRFNDTPHAEVWVEPCAGIAPLVRDQPLFAGMS
jgi:Holliday junction resolvase RusA-like endonuclease